MTTVTGACCRRTGAYAFDRAIMPGEAGPEPTAVIGPRSDPVRSVRDSDRRGVQTGRKGGLTDSRRHGVDAVESCVPPKPASSSSAAHRRGAEGAAAGPFASLRELSGSTGSGDVLP